MMDWWWVVVIAMVSFCVGAVMAGTLLKNVRDVELEDRIVQALHDQIKRDQQAKTPPDLPKE